MGTQKISFVILLHLFSAVGLPEEYSVHQVTPSTPSAWFGAPLRMQGATGLTLTRTNEYDAHGDLVLLQRTNDQWSINPIPVDLRSRGPLTVQHNVYFSGQDIFLQYWHFLDVYTLKNGHWTHLQTIRSPKEPTNYYRIFATAASGDTLAVAGSYRTNIPNTNTPSIRIFKKHDGLYTEVGEFLAPAVSSQFSDVAVKDDVLVASLFDDATLRTEGARIYSLSTLGGIGEQLDLPGAETFDLRVVTNGKWVMVGDFRRRFTNGWGVVYAYNLQNSPGTNVQQVIRPQMPMFDEFGVSMDLSDDELLIGAPGRHEQHFASGAAFLFRFGPYLHTNLRGGTVVGQKWIERHKFVPPDAQQGDGFGRFLALSGGTYLIANARRQGSSVYAFEDLIRLLPQRTIQGMRILWPDRFRSVTVETAESLTGEWREVDYPGWRESSMFLRNIPVNSASGFFRVKRHTGER